MVFQQMFNMMWATFMARLMLNDIPHLFDGGLSESSSLQLSTNPGKEAPGLGYYRLAARGVPAMYLFLYISKRGGTPAEAADYLDFPAGYANEFMIDMSIAQIGDYGGAFQVLQANGLVVGRSSFRDVKEITSRTTLDIDAVVALIDRLLKVGYLQTEDKPFSIAGVFGPMLGMSPEEFGVTRAKLLKAGIERVPSEFVVSLPPPKDQRKQGRLYYLGPKGISFTEFTREIMEAEARPEAIPNSWMSELIRLGVTTGPGDYPGTNLDAALGGFEIPVSSFSSIGLSAVSVTSAVYPGEAYNEINSWTGEFSDISIEEFTAILENAVRHNLLYKTDLGSIRPPPPVLKRKIGWYEDSWTGKKYNTWEELSDVMSLELPPEKTSGFYVDRETGKSCHTCPGLANAFPGRFFYAVFDPNVGKEEYRGPLT